jgi:hypothetical protein
MSDSILARCAGLIGITFIVFALAGCGDTNKPASAGATTSAGTATGGSVTQGTGTASGAASASTTNSGPSTPLRSVSYRATLSGPNPHAPVYHPKPGGPRGSGMAFISIRAASNELCWEFEHLKNMKLPPNEALIAGHVRELGITSTPLSDEHNSYVDAGCASEPRWLEETIEQQPHSFEVVIRNRKYRERPLHGPIQP